MALVAALPLAVLGVTQSVGVMSVVSPSMQPRLATGDHVLVNKLAPELFGLRRGDIAVFEDPGGWAEASARLQGRVAPIRPDTLIVKRVIGVPGDRVTCCAPDGALLRNGRRLDEPYVDPAARRARPLAFDVVVPADAYWVMGDDRARSFDSATAGVVPAHRIVGRVEAAF